VEKTSVSTAVYLMIEDVSTAAVLLVLAAAETNDCNSWVWLYSEATKIDETNKIGASIIDWL